MPSKPYHPTRRRTLRPPRGFLPSAALLLILAVLLTACDSREVSKPAPVILISIDTLRFDRVSCYGYPRPTTPRLAETLCRDGVVFEEAVAHAPSTLPSHASMLTGLLPARHGASFSRERALAPEVTTLAERLREAGYRAASFNDGGQINAAWGLAQGFEVYESLDQDRLAPVAGAALDWLDRVLEEGERERIFLFLHTYETHHPYTPSEEDLAHFETERYGGYLGRTVGVRELRRINQGGAPLAPDDLRFIEDAYDAEIRSMDRALGELVEGLKERGLYRRALIIFTSDHGEEMNERGFVGWHSHTLYDELLRVPLVVKLPGNRQAGKRVPYQVRLADLTPTILDAVGQPVPPGLDGESLLPLLSGPPGGRRLVVSQMDSGAESSIRSSQWKLYEERLYDLRTDPGEQRDVAAGHPQVREALERRREAALAERTEGAEVELSEETVERLRALGYL